MRNSLILIFLGLFFLSNAVAQESEKTNEKSSPIKFSGFVDFYYLYDFNEPFTNDRAPFAFAYQRHNELNINLGLIKASYDDGKVFANIALQTGTYAGDNYAAEPAELRNIAEANVGINLTDKLTFDAGVFPSHIGVESAVNQGCYNLTRSLMADGSPYFETGARLNYNFAPKWNLSALVLNGWQNIYDNNDNKALGSQLTFEPKENITLNYSTFYGNEQPKGSPALMRFFQDFYIQYTDLLPNFSVTAVFDHMLQENLTGGNDEVFAFSGMFYYQFEKTGIGARVEHYNDPTGVINSTGTPNGFQVTSGSVNFDWNVKENVMWRFEGKSYNSLDAILYTSNPLNPSKTGALVATSLSIAF